MLDFYLRNKFIISAFCRQSRIFFKIFVVVKTSDTFQPIIIIGLHEVVFKVESQKLFVEFVFKAIIMVIAYQTMHYIVVECRLQLEVEHGMVVFRLEDVGVFLHRDSLDEIVVFQLADVVEFIFKLGDFDIKNHLRSL